MSASRDPRDVQAAIGLVLALLLLAAVSVWDQREDQQEQTSHRGTIALLPPPSSNSTPGEGPKSARS